jgi:uncharacterized protein DUF5683
MPKFYCLILFLFAVVISLRTVAQNDSTTKVSNNKVVLLDTIQPKKDSATKQLAKKDSLIEKKHHDPQKATIRSAIIPGWGQAYNHEYWKIPIVYGALAIPTSLFIYNNKWYQETKKAYDILVNNDTAKFDEIDPKLQGLSPETLQYYRNNFRKNRDYSVLFLLLVWGVNVADATVFAHLKDFNVSDDLSMRIQPDYNIDTKTPSLSVALNLRDKQHKMLPASF